MKSSVLSLAFLGLFHGLAAADNIRGWQTATRSTICQNGRPCTTATRTTSTISTSCTPTATETVAATLSFATFPTGSPGDGTDLQFGSDWGYIACSVYCSTSCVDSSCTDPSCSNKGSCGPSSTTTDLLFGFPNGSPATPNFTISAKAPKIGFTIYQLTFTGGYFVAQYPSISVELKGESIYPERNPLPVHTFVIPKPAAGSYYSVVTKNLPDLGYGALKKLDLMAYMTGSDGSGGQGPNGRVFAEARVDYDGTGAGVRYETYRPLGCTNYGGVRRWNGGDVSVPARLVMKRTLEGYEFS